MLHTQNLIPENNNSIDKYSNFFILICNVPGIEHTNAFQKKIIVNISESWKIKHNDPHLERLHIIFLNPNDLVSHKKYYVLNQVDAHSKIYIIGHCKPGSDHISSDRIYCDKNKNRCKFEYSYQHIAGILLANITNPNVIFVKSEETEILNKINRPARKLRICVPSCNSSVDSMDETKTIIPSFAQKLFKYITSQTMYLLNSELTGSNGYLFPIASEHHLSSILKLFIKTETDLGFHKRYFLVSGNYDTIFPQHKPGNDYKTTFVLAPNISMENFNGGEIPVVALSVQENHNLYKLQTRFENIVSKCSDILNDINYRNIHQKISPMYHRLISGKIYSENHIQSCERAIDFLIKKAQNDLEKSFEPQCIRS